MIGILEEIIRDESTNPTARCTAIRTLRELQGEAPPTTPSAFDALYEVTDFRRKGANGAS